MKFRFIVLVLILLTVSACGSPDDPDSTPYNPEKTADAVYKFDESSGSVAVNTSSIYFYGTIIGATRIAGKVGNALQFGSAGARVEIPMPQFGYWHEMVFPSNAVTIDAWIKMDSLLAGETYHFLGGDGGGLQSFLLQLVDGKILFLLNDQTSYREVIRGTQAISAGAWYHIAITYDGSTAIIYINGTTDNSNSVTYPIANVCNTLFIGSTASGPAFPGIIDELRIIARARTAQEIIDYYNLTK